MERSRDGYRGRFRDRHNGDSPHRPSHNGQSTRGNHQRQPYHDDEHAAPTNGHYRSRLSPMNQTYRSARSSLNARPVLSRHDPSADYRHQQNDHHSPPHLSSQASTRSGSTTGNHQTNYYDSHPPASRFARSANYSPLLNEQPMSSASRVPLPSPYYGSSSLRDRDLPSSSSSHRIDAERDRYSSSSAAMYRRESSPPSYRHERTPDYGSRNTHNDLYSLRGEYRSTSPPPLASLSMRSDPYGEGHRANDYGKRPERYETLTNRINPLPRDYPMAPVPTASYRSADPYRNGSGVPLPSTSVYSMREPIPSARDTHYRPSSESRDYELADPSSRLRYSSSPSSMDYQTSLPRSSRERLTHDSRPPASNSYRERPNLKRSASRHDDNGHFPSKRPMRR